MSITVPPAPNPSQAREYIEKIELVRNGSRRGRGIGKEEAAGAARQWMVPVSLLFFLIGIALLAFGANIIAAPDGRVAEVARVVLSFLGVG